MQNRLLKDSLKFGMAILVCASLSTPSYAGETQDQVKLCRAAIDTTLDINSGELGSEDYFKLKSVTGASVKKMTFKAKTEKGVGKIICKVKRGQMKALMDGNGLPLQSPKSNQPTP